MLVLKSASPRRREIFEKLGLNFTISPSHVNETQLSGEDYFSYLKRVTLAKLEVSKIPKDRTTYVSSDTIVVQDGKIFPKPSSKEECFQFLSELNGKSHSVFSSLALYKDSEIYYDFDQTIVQIKDLSKKEIWTYIQTQNPLDKAGGYGIQDHSSPVKSFEGSFTNVLGFPLRKFFLYIHLWKEYL